MEVTEYEHQDNHKTEELSRRTEEIVPPGVPVERTRGGDVRRSDVGGWLLGLFRLRVRHPGNLKTQWFTKFVTVSEDLTHKVHHSHIHSS